ncbi:MAG: hypothetical protein LBB49_04365 [Gracilibacteraceae bacterium]|nr:hypothetical protein [Gracilibacteraceae bacterium]
MKKRRLILACGLILLCGLVLGACKNHNESIDENLLGQWGGEHGPSYSFFRNGTYERYPDKRVSGRYTIKKGKITLEPPLRFSDLYKEEVYTYSVVDDTLTLTTKSGVIYIYTRMTPIVP